jgi:hypothetical protein
MQLRRRPQQQARQGKARQGNARQGKARQGKARQGKARQGKARQGKARQGKARQGKARQGKARKCKARKGKAGKADPRTDRVLELRKHTCVTVCQIHRGSRRHRAAVHEQYQLLPVEDFLLTANAEDIRPVLIHTGVDRLTLVLPRLAPLPFERFKSAAAVQRRVRAVASACKCPLQTAPATSVLTIE